MKGEYFQGCDLETLKLERIDAQLAFNWSQERPDKKVPREFISVRWTGAVEARYTELYTFHTLSDDGVRLWVNDRLLIDNWTDHGATEDTGSIRLEAGKRYNVRLEYYQGNGEAVLKLLWSSPHQKKQVIPCAYLIAEQVPRPELPPLRLPALELPAGLPDLPAGADWEVSRSAFAAVGIPRSWLILAPQPDRQFRLFLRKIPLDPEKTDDWRNLLQDPHYLPTLWTRPEGEESGALQVDVGRILNWDNPGLTFARTEVIWPVDGRARVWFSCRARGELFLNNAKLLALDEPPRALRCVTVDLKRGPNVFKVKLGGSGGPWGFSFRVERDDAAFRADLLAKLLLWHPACARGASGAVVYLPLGRALEEAGRSEEALKAFRDARAQSPRDEEVCVEVDEAERRLQGQADRKLSAEQEWPRVVQRAEGLLRRGECAAADAEYRLFIARFPRTSESIDALVRRGRLRQAWGLIEASRGFYQRAMEESPRHPDVLRVALPVLDGSARQSLMPYAAETAPELHPLLEAARRQFRSGTADDLLRAVRNLDDTWRTGAELFVHAAGSNASRRDTGIPLAVRELIEPLDGASLAAYDREVEAIVRAKGDRSDASVTVPELVQRAARYPLSSIALGALNQAANRLMDEGCWDDAAAILERLAPEARRLQRQEVWAVAEAKRIQVAVAAGDRLTVVRRLQALEGRMAGVTLSLRGQEVSGVEFLRRQAGWLQASAASAVVSPPSLPTLNGNAGRTGTSVVAPPRVLYVAWRAPLPQSPAHLRACERAGLDVSAAVYPIVSEHRVFVSNLETLSAFDFENGGLLWQVRHSSGDPVWPAAFGGYPVSSPSCADGVVVLRMANGDRTDLRAYAASDGAPLWRAGEHRAVQDVIWLGDPALACGSVYGVFMERVPNGPARHGVACLDIRSGELKWKRYVLSGTGGWRVGDDLWMPSLNQGPPAVVSGVVYAATGLSSLVALDAFTGQPLWLNAYPAPGTGDVEKEAWFRPCLMHLLRRGPASLLVQGNTVFLAPKDAPGCFAFDRGTGELRWSRDLCDAFQLAAAPSLRLCETGYRSALLDPENGRLAMPFGMSSPLTGCTALAGTRLYAPTAKGLWILDVNGKEAPTLLSWMALEIPPAHSCFVVGEHVLLAGDAGLVLLSPAVTRDASLPLEQARAQARLGNWAEAGRRFALAMHRQRESYLEALTGWCEVHLRMGFERRALAELDYWLSGQPERLVAEDGLWEVDRGALAEGLRARLGQIAPTPPRTMPRGLPGVLAFAGRIPMIEPQLILPAEGPGPLMWAAEQYDICGLQVGRTPKVLWRSYHGLADPRFEVGPTALTVWNTRKLVVLDRMTGQPLWSVALEDLQERTPANARTERYWQVALDRDVVVVATRDVLFAFGLQSGQVRWTDVHKDRHTRLLGLVSGRLAEVGGEKQSYYRAIDVESGKQSMYREWAAGGTGPRQMLSPDRRKLAVRLDDEHVGCLDLASGGWMWNRRVRKLKRETCRLTWREGSLCYEGDAVEGGKPGRWTIELRAQDGEWVREYPSDLWPVDRDFVRCTTGPDEQIELSRLQWAGRGNDEPGVIWRYGLASQVSRGGVLRAVFPSERGERIHLLFTRSLLQPHVVLRSFDWSRGQFLHEEVLPGVPFRAEARGRFEGRAETYEELQIYTATDGLYVYCGAGQTRTEAAASLDRQIGETTGVQAVGDLRRARVGVEPPILHVLRAPDAFRLSGDPDSWEQADALELATPASFVPFRSGAGWRGPDDLSVTLRMLWNPEGLLVSVTVVDDRHVPAAAFAPLETGDALRLVVDATVDMKSGFDPAARWSGTMACAEGRTVFRADPAPPSSAESAPDGGAVLLPDGRGVRYELRIPWALLGRSPAQRPGPARQVRFGLVVFDNDGAGVRGAMEWGADGAARRPFAPWLGELFLLDASREWMTRYRNVISKIPDTPEALDFLRRLVLSHLGPQAAAARVAELEAFIKAHPASPNVVPVLRMLYAAHKDLSTASPQASLIALASEAQCPDAIVRQLRTWPRPVGPGQGLEGEYFDNQDFTGLALVRVDPTIDFGWGNSGPVPSMAPTSFSVRWTGQLVPRFTETYTFHVLSDDGVRLWMDDRLLVDNWTDHPAREDEGRIFLTAGEPCDVKLEYFQGYGGASIKLLWSSLSQPKGLIPAECLFPSGLPFLENTVKAPERAKLRDAYREASYLLSDTQDGAVLFQRLLDTWPTDAYKERIQECEAYLKERPNALHADTILMKLTEWYAATGRDPVASCRTLMQTYRIREAVQRAFFCQHVPAWTNWQVIGPFLTTGLDAGMDEVWPPERGVDLAWKATTESGLALAWKQTEARKSDTSGRVDLRRWFVERVLKHKGKDLENSTCFAYAYRKVRATQQRRAMIFFGAEDVISIWLNGKQIVNRVAPGGDKDAQAVDATLKEGENEILLKVGAAKERLSFYFRIADPNGCPLPDLPAQ